MPEFHQLKSEKYVNEAAQQEAQAIALQKHREAKLMIAQFFFSVAVLAITMVAVYFMPVWLPSFNALLENMGILQG